MLSIANIGNSHSETSPPSGAIYYRTEYPITVGRLSVDLASINSAIAFK